MLALEVRDGIAWLRIDRPERRNALPAAFWGRLRDVAAAIEAEEEVAPSFCTGRPTASRSAPTSTTSPAPTTSGRAAASCARRRARSVTSPSCRCRPSPPSTATASAAGSS